MEQPHPKQEMFLTIKQPETEKDVVFKVISSKHLILLDPTTREHALEVKILDGGELEVQSLDQLRWPEDAGKCLLECSRGCNGDLLCAAGCMALCSTIIIG